MRLSATRRACSKRTPLREATCSSCSSYDTVDGADDRSLGCRGCSLTSRLKIKKTGRAEFCAPSIAFGPLGTRYPDCLRACRQRFRREPGSHIFRLPDCPMRPRLQKRPLYFIFHILCNYIAAKYRRQTRCEGCKNSSPRPDTDYG